VTETDLKNRIMALLRTLPDSYFWRQGATPYGRAGVSDIIGCWDGQFVAMEVKVGDNKPTPAQYNFLQNIKQTGGLTLVPYSLDDVHAFLKENQ
jgi:hypothetical protein